MKVKLSFKTPDAIDRVLEDYDKSDHERIREACEKFIEYDEYVTIEINVPEEQEDTEATAIVLKR